VSTLDSPRQALILCGGLGTRLRPLTDHMPKPLAPVNGKPFLWYLLNQVREQGIKRVVLMTGYRGEMIREWFGTGDSLGLEVTYSQGPEEWDTGRRLWEARALMEPRYLLLYSDNFVQFRLTKLFALHRQQTTPISLLLAPKERGNIRLSADGRIEQYDKARCGTRLDYVEVGYMLIERDQVLPGFLKCPNFPDFSLSTLLEQYANEAKISGLVVRDSYHSISDPKRLELTNQYLKPKRLLLIDRDGTINLKMPRGEYVTSWADFRWIPETVDAMQELADHGFQFIVITNQAGVARKMIDPIEIDLIHRNMISELAAKGITILKVYVSPDHWTGESFTRKPSPGMFFQASRDFNLRMDRCLYIGDDERDCLAAINAGCGMVYVDPSMSDVRLSEEPQPFLRAASLRHVASTINEIYLAWEEGA